MLLLLRRLPQHGREAADRTPVRELQCRHVGVLHADCIRHVHVLAIQRIEIAPGCIGHLLGGPHLRHQLVVLRLSSPDGRHDVVPPIRQGAALGSHVLDGLTLLLLLGRPHLDLHFQFDCLRDHCDEVGLQRVLRAALELLHPPGDLQCRWLPWLRWRHLRSGRLQHRLHLQQAPAALLQLRHGRPCLLQTPLSVRKLRL
mmetsp:Transcript_145130/g.404381  ORF Transcript_145130/g.404381 Transcript_145130/m.404381 type:complete len:200 (+) Transcript_145130:64-663(+)